MSERDGEATRRSRESGFALIIVTLVMAVTIAVIGGGVTLGSNHLLVNRFHQRNDQLIVAGDAGLDWARARLNGDRTLYPDSGYQALESNAAVSNGSGGTIYGVRRSVYVGPIGITSGQYGLFGTIIAETTDAGGARAVRRLMVTQESFAKYAYFTDVEPSNISFGGGDQIFGPLHTNGELKIYSSGATFHDAVTTASTVQGASYATFKKGYKAGAAAIPLPETADLTKLSGYAHTGGTRFTGTTSGGEGQATTRIEFMSLDLNGDGDTRDENEGFIRVYQSNDYRWVSGDLPNVSSPWRNSQLCGHYHAGQVFRSAQSHGTSGSDDWQDALGSAARRCLLGGSDSITGAFRASDGTGSWVQWTGAVSPLLNARTDRNYLFPISRSLNPNFKGVIYVTGNVVLSGRLRGRVTVAASGNVIIGDDVTYSTDPGQGTCVDILGLFAGGDVVVADNTLNAPAQPWSGSSWYTFDDTKDEFIHGAVLTLDQFYVESHDEGSESAESCEGTSWGRGCLYLTGGIIQRTRGPVGTITSNSPLRGTGYVKRYSYDKCGATAPPPYFPTTGHFVRGQSYYVDPVGFTPAAFFALFQNP